MLERGLGPCEGPQLLMYGPKKLQSWSVHSLGRCEGPQPISRMRLRRLRSTGWQCSNQGGAMRARVCARIVHAHARSNSGRVRTCATATANADAGARRRRGHPRAPRAEVLRSQMEGRGQVLTTRGTRTPAGAPRRGDADWRGQAGGSWFERLCGEGPAREAQRVQAAPADWGTRVLQSLTSKRTRAHA